MPKRVVKCVLRFQAKGPCHTKDKPHCLSDHRSQLSIGLAPCFWDKHSKLLVEKMSRALAVGQDAESVFNSDLLYTLTFRNGDEIHHTSFNKDINKTNNSQLDCTILALFAPQIETSEKTLPSLILVRRCISYFKMFLCVKLLDQPQPLNCKDISYFVAQSTLICIDDLVSNILKPVRQGKGDLDPQWKPALDILFIYLSDLSNRLRISEHREIFNDHDLFEHVRKRCNSLLAELRERLETDCKTDYINNANWSDPFSSSQKHIERELKSTKSWTMSFDTPFSNGVNADSLNSDSHTFTHQGLSQMSNFGNGSTLGSSDESLGRHESFVVQSGNIVPGFSPHANFASDGTLPSSSYDCHLLGASDFNDYKEFSLEPYKSSKDSHPGETSDGHNSVDFSIPHISPQSLQINSGQDPRIADGTTNSHFQEAGRFAMTPWPADVAYTTDTEPLQSFDNPALYDQTNPDYIATSSFELEPSLYDSGRPQYPMLNSDEYYPRSPSLNLTGNSAGITMRNPSRGEAAQGSDWISDEFSESQNMQRHPFPRDSDLAYVTPNHYDIKPLYPRT